MLPAHIRALAVARSYLAALADTATTFDATLEYDRVLLELDTVHGDHTPALYAVPATESALLYAAAEAAIEALAGFGVDALRVELLLAALEVARALDGP